jgi:archaellum biogenesis ATPase FlaH
MLRPFKNNGEAIVGIPKWSELEISEDVGFQAMPEFDAIGAMMGTKTEFGYIICIDVDSDSIEKKALAYQVLQTTRKEFGSRGAHYFFILDIDHPPKSKKWTNGTDSLELLGVMGNGSPHSVLVAPSTHRKTGKQYTVLKDVEPMLISIEQLKDALEALASECNLKELKLLERPKTTLGNEVIEGGRNNAIFSNSCILCEHGMSETAAVASMKEYNKSNCKPPLSDLEVETAVKSAFQKAKPQPKATNMEPVLNWARTLVGKPLETKEYVVQNLIPKEALILLGAKRAHYKTSISMYLAIMASRGAKACDLFATKKTRTLIVDGESGDYLVRSYLKRFGCSVEDEIAVVDMFDLRKFTHNWKAEELIDYIEKNSFQFVVIDSLRRAFSGDENESGKMSEFLTDLKKVANKTKASVMLIHHERKSYNQNNGSDDDVDLMENLRGSSDIAAAVDMILQLVRKGGSEMAELHITKNRFAPESKPYTLMHVTDDDGNEKFTAQFGTVEESSYMKDEFFKIINSRYPTGEARLRTSDIVEIMKENDLSQERTTKTFITRVLKKDGYITASDKKAGHTFDMVKVMDYLIKRNILNESGKQQDPGQKKLGDTDVKEN